MAANAPAAYECPVCYAGEGASALDVNGEPCVSGWHYTVVVDAAGDEVPGEPLFLEEDGSYRLVSEGDQSWHERKHQIFQTFQLEDGSVERVTQEEGTAVRELLARLRSGQIEESA